MAIKSEKIDRTAGSVAPASSVASHFFGSEAAGNSNLISSMVAQQMTLLSMTIAFNVEMAHQFSSLVFSAWDQSLGAVSNSQLTPNISRSDLSVAQPATAESRLRVVVDNVPGAQEPTTVTEKVRKQTTKSAEPVGKSEHISKPVDDLKRISGIGPKLEKLLHDKGIRQFSDLAKLSSVKVNKLDAELALGGRVVRDQWVEKAKASVKEQA